MAIPGNLTTVVVTIDFSNVGGIGDGGTVSFAPPLDILDANGGAILSRTPFPATLIGGVATITLPVTDDPDMNPVGWGYTVTIALSGLPYAYSYTGVQIPASFGASVNLAQLLPPGVITPPTPNTYGVLAQPNEWAAPNTFDNTVTVKGALTANGVTDWINVKAYPYLAKGDGTSDDTAAINAAITALQARGGGVAYFPAGTYLVTPASSTTAALVLNNGTTGYQGIRLVGDNSKASVIKRSAAGPILSMSGPASDITGATHCTHCALENLVLSGNNLTGTLLQTYYADNLIFADCQFNNSADVIQDCAEFWDSRYLDCVWNSSGSATGGATAPNLWLRNSAATSGFGYSPDTVNNIYLVGSRFEQPTTGAVRIERGLGANSGQPYSIHFIDTKIETAQVNGGPLLYVDATARDIHVLGAHLYAGGFHAGFSTAQDAVVFGPQFGTIRDVLIFNATAVACIANGLTLNAPLAKAWVVAENVRGSYTGGATPTGAHLNFGTNTGSFYVVNCNADNGTQFAGNTPSAATQTIVTSNTGNGTFGITNLAAVAGNLNADLALVQATAASNAFGLSVAGDTMLRYLLNAKGDAAYGNGTAADYTSLRIAAGVHGLSKSLQVGSATDLGDGGVGVLKLANATTSPPSNPTGGVVVYSAGGIIKYKNPQGLLENFGGVIQTTPAPVTVANTAAASGLQSFSVPANDPVAGAVYVAEGWGVYSDTGTPTLAFALYWGGVAGTATASIPAITLGSGVANLPFRYKASVEWQSTTQCTASLELRLGTAASGLSSAYVGTPAAPTTGLTTTSAQTLAVAVTWSAASVSNTITLNGGHLRRLA